MVSLSGGGCEDSVEGMEMGETDLEEDSWVGDEGAVEGERGGVVGSSTVESVG